MIKSILNNIETSDLLDLIGAEKFHLINEILEKKRHENIINDKNKIIELLFAIHGLIIMKECL